MKNLSDFTDQRGFIHHLDADGSKYGDSAQRTFGKMVTDIVSGKKLTSVDIEVKFLQLTRHGDFRRHWDENFWPGQAGSGSRDNFTPALLALVLVGSPLAQDIMKKIFKRFGFLWNTRHIGQQGDGWKPADFVGPLLPLIAFGKLDQACWYMDKKVTFAVERSKSDPSETSDDLNLQLCLMLLDFLVPEKIQAARDYYCKNRADVPGYQKYGVHGYRQALIQYYDSAIAPPLDLEYIKAYEALGWKR